MALPIATPPAHADARRTLSLLRWSPLAAIALNLGLIGGQIALYPPLLAQPGSSLYLVEPVVLLLGYAALVAGLTRATVATALGRLAALWQPAAFGLIAGAMWIVNLTMETWGYLHNLGLFASAPLLLGAFLLWGIAGFLRARRTGSLGAGVVAAVWSALLCVLATITYGLLLVYVALPRLIADEATDPDFARSHWPDLHAFVIANSLDAAFSHLLGALIVALVVGTIGGLIGLVARPGGSQPPRAMGA